MISGQLRFVALAGALLGGAMFVMAQDAPDNFLELDGNSAVNGTACSAPNTPSGCRDDWDLLNGNGVGAHPGAAGGSLARSFISGSASVAVFAGGGSKDPSDISSWKWKNGGTPDKDAITNGYAAAYQAPSGHLILEFGADRFAVNGDANIGFWFFQQDVHPTGAGSGGGSPFSGVHVKNDIFVVSAFTQGGGVSTITVYVWDSACGTSHSGIDAIVNNPIAGQCGDSNLRLKFASTPSATCSGIGEGCAIVNPAPINVNWPYLAKFGSNSTTIPEGGFYEGGLDVTQLLGAANITCFTSFLIETRTSQTTSAVLKDFVSGTFNICGLNATKTCPANGVLNASGTSIHYLFTGTAANVGIGGLSDVTIVDSLPAGSSNAVFKKGSSPYNTPPTVPPTALPTVVSASACPTGSPVGATCADLGSVSAGATEYWTVEFDSTALTVQNNAYAAGAAGGSVLGSCGGSTVCSTNQVASCSTAPTNSITISKNCAVPKDYLSPGNPATDLPGTQLVTQSTLAAVQVNFSGVITNTGQTTVTGITVTDNPGATALTVAWPGATGTLAPGASANYAGNYLPTGVTTGDLGTIGGRYGFSDEVKVTGATGGLGTGALGHDATCTSTFASDAQACGGITCNICPGSPGGLCAGN